MRQRTQTFLLFGIFVFLYFYLMNSNSTSLKNLSVKSNEAFALLKSTKCVAGEGGTIDDQLKYAIVLDAGSTGSRIHVYRFNYCSVDSPELEDEVFVATRPGLSHFTSDPEEAASSLEILMQAALESVPKSLYHCTPLTLKATAGLRMLENGMGATILSHVAKKLEGYPFPVFSEGGVEIMGGDSEGVFAWITLNFLLGKIGGSTSGTRLPTAGVMDLGGGSTQLVLEDPTLPVGPHRIDLDFSGQKYILYQHSYDGYGLMQGRKKIGHASLKTSGESGGVCLPKDVILEINDETTGTSHLLKGSAKGFDMCEQLISSHLFDKKQSCNLSPCSFDGVFMPPILPHQEIYAFSYFFDKFANPFDLHKEFAVGQVKTAAEDICSPNPPQNLSPEGVKELKKNKEWCTDLGFMYSLLSVGYSLPDDRMIQSTKKVNGIEIGWSLGAAIKMINSNDNKCSIK